LAVARTNSDEKEKGLTIGKERKLPPVTFFQFGLEMSDAVIWQLRKERAQSVL
jgi:hypothetical protein